MIDLLDMQKQLILAHLGEGDTAIDFTMGNGGDTLFLSRTVGETGKVYAFDIQDAALVSTAAFLESEGAPQNYTLIKDSHHKVLDYVKGPIKAGMFNLGYLPRSGHKETTTMRVTTLPAVQAALSLLDRDGVLLVAVYPGHEEGRLEGEMLTEYFATLDRRHICVTCIKIVNSPTSPYFFVCETRA